MNLDETILTGEVETALTLSKIVQLTKILFAAIISYAYFSDAAWLMDVIVIAVVTTLISPFGFFAAFIQKLLNYNMHCIERRQILNAEEANKHFTKAFREIEALKKRISTKTE